MSSISAAWLPIDLELETRDGVYLVSRIGDGWSAQYRGRRGDTWSKVVPINTLDERGCSSDWPTKGSAQLACQTHEARMLGYGESADVAAVWVQRNADILDMREAG